MERFRSHARGADLRERLERALAELGPAIRATVVLRDVQGASYEEIAEVTGVPIGTVKSRLARGRAQLRELLSPEPGRAAADG